MRRAAFAAAARAAAMSVRVIAAAIDATLL